MIATMTTQGALVLCTFMVCLTYLLDRWFT